MISTSNSVCIAKNFRGMIFENSLNLENIMILATEKELI